MLGTLHLGTQTGSSQYATSGGEASARRAAELGISRSRFFAVAPRRYLDELDSGSTTAQINDVLNDVSADDSAAVAAVVGRDRLSVEDDW